MKNKINTNSNILNSNFANPDYNFFKIKNIKKDLYCIEGFSSDELFPVEIKIVVSLYDTLRNMLN